MNPLRDPKEKSLTGWNGKYQVACYCANIAYPSRYRGNIMNSANKKAFTLIELLVVIAIIALLLSILTPALNRVKAQAKAAVCRSNIKQWGGIFTMYAQSNKESFPQNYPGDGLTEYASYWCHATLSYYQYPKIRFCPASKINKVATAMVKDGQSPGMNYGYGGTFKHWGPFEPSDKVTETDWWDEYPEGSYGMNEWCSNPPSDTEDIWGAPVDLTWRKINMKRPNNVPLFMDCKLTDTYPRDYHEPPAEPDAIPDFWDYVSKPFNVICMDRHNGGINIVFADASARKVGLKKLWTLKWNPRYDISNEWTKSGGATPAKWRDAAPWMAGFPDY